MYSVEALFYVTASPKREPGLTVKIRLSCDLRREGVNVVGSAGIVQAVRKGSWGEKRRSRNRLVWLYSDQHSRRHWVRVQGTALDFPIRFH